MKEKTTTSEIENGYVKVEAGPVGLDGFLDIPSGAEGLVVFVHGSGSSRMSPRNQFVAHALRRGGLATLLFDLLTDEEEDEDQYTRRLRFDIDLLTGRLAEATDWVVQYPITRTLKVGYFGASTGAAAALQAAAERPHQVHAVVSRGGRPDLAMPILAQVKAPTLLIVGGRDEQVLALNRQALARLRCEKKLEVVPDATHLFEEPGALEAVAHLARQWLQEYLAPATER